MTTPQIAVIGAGLIGLKHAQLLRNRGALAAIVDPMPPTNDLGCPVFADLSDCLAKVQIDGAIVATPNHLHVPVSQVLVDHGIPALIEKPIADTALAADALTAAAASKGVPLLVGHHRRHNPIIQTAHDTIASGQLGTLTLIDAKFWLYKPDDYFDQTWRTRDGAGPIFINLIHDIDLLRYLCGDITHVQAAQSNKTRGFDVEDTAVVLLEFASGALGTVSLSDTTVAPWSWEFTAAENPAYPHCPGPAYRIGGTKGALSLPDMKYWHHPGSRSWWQPIEVADVPFTPADALEAQLSHFFDVIAGRAAPLVTAQSATASLKTVEAIKRAAISGTRQAV